MGLIVKTTKAVNDVTVNGVNKYLNRTSGKAILEDGSEGKIWLIKFVAPTTAGDQTYKVCADDGTTVVEKEIVVKVR